MMLEKRRESCLQGNKTGGEVGGQGMTGKLEGAQAEQGSVGSSKRKGVVPMILF